MRAVKLTCGALLAALGLWLLLLVFEPEGRAQPAGEFTSSRQCEECHAEVYAEWEGSQHSLSWDNPDVRALSNDYANTDCIDCHAPRPVFETGIGKRVLPRTARRSEGVDCIACHALPAGGVAGTRDFTQASCRPVATIDLQRPEFCAGCHDQHETVQQWKASRFFEAGIGCLDCHMPYRDGDPNRGRDHRCLGGHDLALVRSAVELRGRREGDAWVVEVENVGAGHSYPTDERSRASDVFWRPAGKEGAPWRHLWRFRSPYRSEVDVPDTLLPSGETWSGRIEDPDAKAGVEVGLFYKLSPYWTDPEAPDPDAESRLVHSLELLP